MHGFGFGAAKYKLSTGMAKAVFRSLLMLAAGSGLQAAHFAAAAAIVEVQFDASSIPSAPERGYFHMGQACNPARQCITINNRYLEFNRQAWLPVMGEYHFSRDSDENWLSELQKMRAAGVNIVSSYIIWNHHELRQGQFDWQGRRNLRKFMQLAQQAGLMVVLRVGPWAHAEARYGGFPDWLVDSTPLRKNDPAYLHQVERLYQQIAEQGRGLLWKDGGPVIAIQLENEFNLNGQGQGAEHILQLKQIARRVGLDVPLYTVTGWDGTLYPSGEVTPVFGGYPDEPWARSKLALPPKETYAFRFDHRVSGDLGAQTAATQAGTAETDIDHVPFLGAEYGAGLPAMYRRRTLVSQDDIAAMLPTQLGSGLNLLGYYMFHGGRNPSDTPSLEENTAIGGYNDTPKINYDFNAPLGPDGQQRPVLQALRPFHYFLQQFGSQLASMTVRQPSVLSAGPADLTTLRAALRSDGHSGFLFVNNYVRQYSMAAQKDLQFSVQLADRRIRFPSEALTIPDGAYFIWPVGLSMADAYLRYATAQPLTVFKRDSDRPVYVFAAAPDIPVEFSFQRDSIATLSSDTGEQIQDSQQLLLKRLKPGIQHQISITTTAGKKFGILLLTQQEARQLTVFPNLQGGSLLLSQHSISLDKTNRLSLHATGSDAIDLYSYPALTKWPAICQPGQFSGLFQQLHCQPPVSQLNVVSSQERSAATITASTIGGAAHAAIPPFPEQFSNAASWQIKLNGHRQLPYLEKWLLELPFRGNFARLYNGSQLLDDWYFNGQRWQYAIRPAELQSLQQLKVAIYPLHKDDPIYLAKEFWPAFGSQQQISVLDEPRIVPEFKLQFAWPAGRNSR